MTRKTKQPLLAQEIDAVRHYIGSGLRGINGHQKQFMARGSKDFLQSLRGEA